MKVLSFKRIEKKYLINQSQYEELLKGIRGHMKLDPYCENNKTYKIIPRKILILKEKRYVSPK